MKNRKILIDTETTGFNPNLGDKIVEIAALELFDDAVLGKEFHFYINPMRDIPAEVIKVHGITNEKVANCPNFSQIADDFISFIGTSKMIAHNASFDQAFINYELKHVGKSTYDSSCFIDTLALAKQKFPRMRNSLDDLCERFGIDKTARADYHGALIDITLLKEVYVYLLQGQKSIFENMRDESNFTHSSADINYKAIFPRREFVLSSIEEETFNSFIKKNIMNSKWL